MTTLIMVALFVLLTQNKGTIATADTQELLEDKVLMLTFLLLSLSLSFFLLSYGLELKGVVLVGMGG